MRSMIGFRVADALIGDAIGRRSGETVRSAACPTGVAVGGRRS
jgi:hypothetical protein